jgi:hypothetical protein
MAALGGTMALTVAMLITGCGDDGSPGDPVDAAPGDPVDAAPGGPVDAAPGGPVDAAPGDPVDAAPGDPVDAAPGDPVDAAPGGPVDAAPGDPVDAAPPITFAARGTAAGLLGPVALELNAGGDIEPLAVTQDGTFAFTTRLEDGTSYTVTIVDPNMPCTLGNETGVVDGADVAIDLTCTGPRLASLTVNGVAPAIAFAPDTTDYTLDLPLLQSSVTVTATVATAGDDLAIAGALTPSGTPSAPIALNLGDNTVDIVVENTVGWQHTYRLTLRRAGRLAQYAYGKASNPDVGDSFGTGVALSGDTLAVGAPEEDSAATGVNGDQSDDSAQGAGAVYVFRRVGTTWQQQAYIKPSNTDPGDFFGGSVALSGDTLAVGALEEGSAATGVNGDQTDNSATAPGAVYVFRRTGSTWQQEAYIKASNTGDLDAFGHAMALSGDTLAVGAPGEDSAATGVNGNQNSNAAPNSGAVYVFRRTGTTWAQEAYIKASNTGTQDDFGGSVALSGDTLAVGAIGESSDATGINGDQNNDDAGASGAAYVFRRTGTSWAQEAYIKASNTESSDFFGVSVALSGNTLAVGAEDEDAFVTGVNGNQSSNTAPNSGAVYVFRHTGTSWTQEAYVKASNTNSEDRFGVSVALAGDLLAVGARGEASAATGVDGNQASNSASSSGAAYVFRRTGTTWAQTAYVKASNTGGGDLFGEHIAATSDTIAVVAISEASAAAGIDGDQNDDSAYASGAVYVFH